MIDSLFYMVLAGVSLGFLIFIHELGHYWMARRVGMRVETFSIGFGKPLFSWERDGVKWQIGWLPFGGYVKIAGMDNDATVNPYEIPHGFYGKSAWDRIKVAFMGPAVNILFAFVIFGLLWSLGGREKSYAEVTSKIGWVDPHSELYAQGVRPGDEITAYDGRPFEGSKDHVYAAMSSSKDLKVEGLHKNYETNQNEPFSYTTQAYHDPRIFDKTRKTTGILSPANYLIYSPHPEQEKLFVKTPLSESGIEQGDRLVWVDGELIFSTLQFENLLNDGRSLLTIVRDGKVLLVRVPRIHAEELKFTPEFKEELIDWQFEAQLNDAKIQKLFVIPYNLTNDCIVESRMNFIDREKQEDVFVSKPLSSIEAPLETDDKIIAIDGVPVAKAYDLLKLLQTHQVHIIVQRAPVAVQKISYRSGDLEFDRHLDLKEINAIAATIGTDKPLQHAGEFFLLNPIEPKRSHDIERSPQGQEMLAALEKEQANALDGIKDPEQHAFYERIYREQKNKWLIGLPHTDRKMSFNPSPLELFSLVFDEILHTLEGLFSGALSPKWLSGPVGIVQVVHNTWMVSAKEALFWIGAISLNLGALNLLPIPVLDGGTIALCLFEIVTGRKLQPKTLEKIVLPFAVLLITFFVFVTYHDVLRIFG